MANQLSTLAIPAPSHPVELGVFAQWLQQNAPNDPRINYYFTGKGPQPDYDYYNAWRDSLSASKQTGHWSDKWKFPWHPQFSDESVYYQPGQSAKHWTQGDLSVPAGTQGLSNFLGTA